MKKQSPVFRKLLLIFSIFVILMCPLLFIGVRYFPSSMFFLGPLLCPSGMHLEQEIESISDARGNATASYLVCTDGRERVDISGRMLIILFGVGILGVGLLVIWALISPSMIPPSSACTQESG